MPTIALRSRERAASCSAIRLSSRRERSTSIALTLFWSCDFWSWHCTTSPVGRCVMRTALSVVFTLWPPGPLRAEDVDAQVLVLDPDVHLLGLRQHGHGGGRGVDAPLRLGDRHALHPVHARLAAQRAVGVVAADREDGLLEAARGCPRRGR